MDRSSPLMAGVHVAPYAYCHRCPCKEQRSATKDCCNNPLNAVELLLRQQTGPADTAAILLVSCGHCAQRE